MVFEWPKVVNVKIKAFLGGGRKGRGRNCVCVCVGGGYLSWDMVDVVSHT